MAATSFSLEASSGFASPPRGRGKAEPFAKGRFLKKVLSGQQVAGLPALDCRSWYHMWPVLFRSHRPYVAGLHLVL